MRINLHSLVASVGPADLRSRCGWSWTRCSRWTMIDGSIASKPRLAQTKTGAEEEVYQELSQSGIHIGTGLKARGFKISPKSAVLPAASKAAKRVHRRLLLNGIKVKLVSTERDLGIGAGAGRARALKVAKTRFTKGLQRASRNKILSSVNGSAKKLFLPGTVAAMKWGNSAFGTPKYRLRKVRTLGAIAAGKARRGRCTFVTTKLQYDRDPVSVILAEQVSDWKQLWQSADIQDKKRVRALWPKTLRTVSNEKGRWMRVKGPMLAIQAMLRDWGWQPISPVTWLTPDSQRFLLEDADKEIIYHVVDQAVAQEGWRHAAQHYEGQGAENGVDLRSVCKRIQQWKKEKDYLRAGVAECILSGGQWPMQRIADCRLGF